MTQTTAQLDLPDPSVDVTPSGVFISWNAYGLNIEMRVRDQVVWAHIEDACGEVPHFMGDRSAASHVLGALCKMECRKP